MLLHILNAGNEAKACPFFIYDKKNTVLEASFVQFKPQSVLPAFLNSLPNQLFHTNLEPRVALFYAG